MKKNYFQKVLIIVGFFTIITTTSSFAQATFTSGYQSGLLEGQQLARIPDYAILYHYTCVLHKLPE